jgi:AraC family transcriptional regulator, regulatory protein of adaptative response / DNA-3-methyladenine glycosylase II
VEALEGGHYYRSFQIGGSNGIIRVSRGGEDWLDVRVSCQNLAVLPKVIAKVRTTFDLATDPAAINGDLSKDPMMAALITKRVGLRVPSSWDGFEGVVRAVLGQQITVKAAIALGSKLVSALGASLTPDIIGTCGVSHLFPDPARVASADLSFMPMPQSRQRTLKAVALAFVELPDILRGEYGEVRARLAKIPGVGPWTLDYIALRALRDPDSLPSTDVALVRAFAQLRGEVSSPVQLCEHGVSWQPWRSYAAQHLWASLAD